VNGGLQVKSGIGNIYGKNFGFLPFNDKSVAIIIEVFVHSNPRAK